MNIYDDVNNLKGVGPKTSKLLNENGIFSLMDLLLYFPRDYEKIKKCVNFDDFFYEREGNVIVKCKAREIKRDIRTKNGKIISIILFSDGNKILKAKWFNQPYIKNKFIINSSYTIKGKFVKDNYETTIINPVIINDKEIINEIEPIYSLKGKLTNSLLKKLILQVLKNIVIVENIPEWIIKNNEYCSLDFAMRNIHQPKDRCCLLKATERLKFQELLMYSIKILMIKKFINENKKGISFNIMPQLEELESNLPYKLTNAQDRVVKEILIDEKKNICMNRLVQGDVGSGKTIVAAIAIFNVVMNGYQAAMMAPTEILAKQHYLELKKLFVYYNLNIEVLSGSLSPKRKNSIKEKLYEGKIDIIIGTHALLEENVTFSKLGLVVTDEQHRFGVMQRSVLMNKNNNVDTLVMTATPIPRTLSLYLYGDLDISTIDELPPGRKKINTYFRKKDSREKIYKFVRDEINNGRQAYIVCPLIDDNENLDLTSVESLYNELKEKYFYDLQIDVLHGKMSSENKEKIMEDFKLGKTKVLISTTVIEVGVNVPNATVMVIENAERFGLSQLHQLRGRVGRGSSKSYCILIGEIKSDITKKRMKIITSSNDGFQISEEDLNLRGSGDIFGVRQHGENGLILADLLEDIDLFKLANVEARKLLNSSDFNDIKVKNDILNKIEKSSNFICFN